MITKRFDKVFANIVFADYVGLCYSWLYLIVSVGGIFLTPLLWLKFIEGNGGTQAVEFMEQTGDMSGVSLLAIGKAMRIVIVIFWLIIAVFWILSVLISLVALFGMSRAVRGMY